MDHQITLTFEQEQVLQKIKHFLPAQGPLKDFIHHNTLHAFQQLPFFEGIRKASRIFGYKVSLSLSEFRGLFRSGRIHSDVLKHIVAEQKGGENLDQWMNKMLHQPYNSSASSRIGALRAKWKGLYHIDLDGEVQPGLFRILCSYLDQGISIWAFPKAELGLISAIRYLEHKSFTSFFRTKRAKQLLLSNQVEISSLLTILVGDRPELFEQYLFDQQFSHQGWSGIVSSIESDPTLLMDTRKVSLKDLITLELLLEIDALDRSFPNGWEPLGAKLRHRPQRLFDPVILHELDEVLALWQQAFEWTYFDQVLAGISAVHYVEPSSGQLSFQAMFCIDDRECSLRRYLERLDQSCRTFGTPGFFGVDAFYQPEHGKFYSKICPAPVQPVHLIKELNAGKQPKHQRDLVYHKRSHSFLEAWVMSQTLGFVSAFKLFQNIFKPSANPAMASSFKHMHPDAYLTVKYDTKFHDENDLQIGYRVEEMAFRVKSVLRSIGLVDHFAPIVYVIGHGASSVNNPHFAAYDCGACSGKAGSVNARAFCQMANDPDVRNLLSRDGIFIPDETQFVGGLHDTTRDDIVFYDEQALSTIQYQQHEQNKISFNEALDMNAKERSRRLVSIDTSLRASQVHEKIRERSVSIFEPRPELNHATNTLCVVGRRHISKGVFLDRRSFLNSYDYTLDPEGDALFNILKAATPVCGGINLEYYFSRTDNQKFGAGSKLPHNVMGLIGVANGIDGDLRPGLPQQMIEIHDPLRLLFIVEQKPEIVLKTIQRTPELYHWYLNEWVLLVVHDAECNTFFRFNSGGFVPYHPLQKSVPILLNLEDLLVKEPENLPVYLIPS
jgi:uncharacterized protein